MKAFTIWTDSIFFIFEFKFCNVICVPHFGITESDYFAGYDNFCGGLYLATTKKTYTIQ